MASYSGLERKNCRVQSGFNCQVNPDWGAGCVRNWLPRYPGIRNTRYDWLRNSDKTDKETASKLWNYSSSTWAEKGWKRLLGWVSRCRLKPVIAVGKTIRNHLWGIINATKHKVTNAKAKGINSKIQALKKIACGYRNRERFREAILFHLGGLNLHP